MPRQMTKHEIREYHGHGMGNRRVRIARDGHVTYYGSPDDCDRGHDWWHEGGYVEGYRIETARGIEDAYRL